MFLLKSKRLINPKFLIFFLITFGLVYTYSSRDHFKVKSILAQDESLPCFEQLQQNVIQTIGYSEKLDGIREGLFLFFKDLCTEGTVEKFGSDDSIRPYFVSLQGIIEQNMAFELKRGKIKQIQGVIHTPTPATPLCTEGKITERLVHSSMQADENRLLTVRSRADVVRDFLDFGGVLYAVYPQGGLEKRSLVQQNTYLKTVRQYPELLYDYELESSYMDHDMIGATYLFESNEGEEYLFSIQAFQANAPENNRKWKLWFGKTTESQIAARLSRVRSFLRDHQGPELQLR